MASIQGVYVALFGRPADPTGLNYFNSVTNNGANLSAIGDLAATAEYQARFDGMSSQQIITSIYNSLFDRNPEQAGLDFFVQALANGTYSINNIAIAILDGAQGDDLTLVEKKVAAADLFTAAIDTPDEIAAYSGTAAAADGIAFIDAVTATSAEVDAAAADAAVAGVTPEVTGETFTLTTDAGEQITGTVGNDTFNAVIGTGATLNTFDKVDGGAGEDTAVVVSTGTNQDLTAAQAAQFVGVETLKLSIADGGTAGQAAIDISETDIRNFTVAGDGMTAAAVVTVAEGTTVSATTAAAGALAVTGAKDVTALSAVATGTNVNAFTFGETNTSVKTVTASGDAAATVTVTGTATTETMNVSLDNDTALTVAGGSVTTLDMSGSKGDIGVTLLAGIETVKGGAGADTVTDVTGADAVSVDLGAGNDTFVVAAGDATKVVDVTLGAGSDTVDVNALANADVDAIADTVLVITDFNKSEDVLDLAGIAGTDGYVVLNNTQLANIAAESTIEDAVAAANAFLDTTNDDGFTAFNYGSDMYVLKGDGTAALADTDGIMKVVGVSVDDMDASNFVTA